MVPVTSIYGGALALLFLVLSLRVIRYRRGNRISLGDHGDRALEQRMRAQGNCAEYAPIAVLLLLLAELQGAPGVALHFLGLLVLIGRLAHGYALSATPMNMRLRVIGMVSTLSMILITASGLVLHGLF